MRSFIICTPLVVIKIIRSRRMRWVGHVEHMGEMRNVQKILVGKPEGKRLLEGLRHRWEDNIKMKELGCGLDSSGSGQGLLAGFCEHSNKPSGSTSA
jgi:hypothetical protein